MSKPTTEEINEASIVPPPKEAARITITVGDNEITVIKYQDGDVTLKQDDDRIYLSRDMLIQLRAVL